MYCIRWYIVRRLGFGPQNSPQRRALKAALPLKMIDHPLNRCRIGLAG
jgi:hypothetical protein